jgi:hypothetical protein
MDEKIGNNTRKKYSYLFDKKIDKSYTTIFDIKRSFTYNRKTCERIQFPLRPSAGKTIHKSQGDTLDEVVINMSSKCKAKIHHIHYVALSRVRSLNGLHIVDFSKDKIAVSDSVKEELQRLRKSGLLKLCYTPLYNLGNYLFRFVFNNVRSLYAHLEDIKADPMFQMQIVLVLLKLSSFSQIQMMTIFYLDLHHQSEMIRVKMMSKLDHHMTLLYTLEIVYS